MSGLHIKSEMYNNIRKLMELGELIKDDADKLDELFNMAGYSDNSIEEVSGCMLNVSNGCPMLSVKFIYESTDTGTQEEGSANILYINDTLTVEF